MYQCMLLLSRSLPMRTAEFRLARRAASAACPHVQHPPQPQVRKSQVSLLLLLSEHQARHGSHRQPALQTEAPK